MFLRFGYFEVVAGGLNELRALYNERCSPVVKRAKGNLDAYLLEPGDGGTAAAVCTIWESEADAQAYEASSTAREMVEVVRHLFAGPPTLRSYSVTRRTAPQGP